MTRVTSLERQLASDVDDRRFHPYLQLHEFEALLLSSPEGLSFAASAPRESGCQSHREAGKGIFFAGTRRWPTASVAPDPRGDSRISEERHRFARCRGDRSRRTSQALPALWSMARLDRKACSRAGLKQQL